MLRRRHRKDDLRSEALYSPCGTWRYRLTRRWGAGRLVTFILLNPSTATERADDPTLARCVSRARALEAGGVCVVNLFALRATDPRALRQHPDPIGPKTDGVLLRAARQAGMLICGWGNHGALRGRDAQVRSMLQAIGVPLFHLGLTANGQPRHPLYVRLETAPILWHDSSENCSQRHENF
ncbi:hypothetical protein LV82_00502 [Albidovulum inexpectatum]|uniref:DUF1643 domain-containing protein n=1 Tax=Albidovulum inexpectatum TaxID=196587 RepID=A0A2S5JM44_9RHOB|nr:DUF1643 domain-containing protein [Albidovulum inexpectatum]PPB82564.1 hypothetical protein LV82_00502 [Albidovulum inexpectatum]